MSRILWHLPEPYHQGDLGEEEIDQLSALTLKSIRGWTYVWGKSSEVILELRSEDSVGNSNKHIYRFPLTEANQIAESLQNPHNFPGLDFTLETPFGP